MAGVSRMVLAVLAAVMVLPRPIIYEGRQLYPYFCTKTWVCDFVPEEIYRRDCRTRPCQAPK